MASTTPFLTAVANRRSMYALANTSPISKERILEIVTHAVKYAPSPFNVRSTRCMVLFGDEHNKLWNHAYEVTARDTPDALRILGPKIEGYRAVCGSVLFFDDSSAYNALTPRFSALSKQFPEWEEHSSGMHQFIVWTALEAEGLGASLQHYSEQLSSYVRETYGVAETWKLKCQLVFGEPVQGAGEEKTKTGLQEAVRSFGEMSL